MAAIWIVHRDPAMRASLARLAGAPPDSPADAPGAPVFDGAAAPQAILLGLAGDLEAELEFAHRMAPRLRGTRWILVGEPADLERAHGLFDTLPADFFTFPPEPSILRAALAAAGRPPGREPLPLSQRPARDALSERFSRAFSDLELPELLHAFDPRLARLPVLALGEPGTGRSTLVRYVHQLGPTLGGTLVELDCTPDSGAEALLERIALAARHDRSRHATSLWLRGADRLDEAVQREVAGWIAYGLPWGVPRTRLLRWLGTAAPHGLDPELRRALGGLCVTIPPLRERIDRLPNLANATAAAWCNAHDLPPRRLAEDALAALAEYPWPGNLAELEAVIYQSLAASGADPLHAADLVLDGLPFVPVPATDLGTLLEEEEPEAAGPAATGEEIEHALEELVSVPFGEAGVREEELPEAVILEPEPVAGGEREEHEEPPPQAGAEREEHEEPPAPWAGPELEEGEVTPLPEASPDEPPLDLDLALLEPPAEPFAPPAPGELAPEAGLPPPPEEGGEAASTDSVRTLQRLAAAVGHEVRNPLTAVRTFAQLLPERFEDPEFRSHFSRLAEESLGRVEEVLSRLERLAGFPAPERRPVDVGALLREVLDKRRGTIHQRRLVVLEELDRTDPTAFCDPEQLRFAFEALIDESLELVPERGDVYLASRRHEAGLRGAPSVRILLRYRGPHGEAAGGGALAPAAHALAFALAEIVVRAQGGTLALDTSDRSETVLVLDLPS